MNGCQVGRTCRVRAHIILLNMQTSCPILRHLLLQVWWMCPARSVRDCRKTRVQSDVKCVFIDWRPGSEMLCPRSRSTLIFLFPIASLSLKKAKERKEGRARPNFIFLLHTGYCVSDLKRLCCIGNSQYYVTLSRSWRGQCFLRRTRNLGLTTSRRTVHSSLIISDQCIKIIVIYELTHSWSGSEIGRRSCFHYRQ